MSASRTLLLALLALAVTAAPARAGEYTVTACPSPLGVQPERGGWAFDPGGLNTQPGAPSCGTGFALSLWLAGDQPAQHWAAWTFDPPPELPVVGYRIERRWHINGTTGPMAWFYDYSAAEWNQAGQPTAAEYCSPSQCPAPGPAGSDTQPPLVRSGILADKVVLQLGCGFSPYNCPQVNDPQGGGSVLVRKAEMRLRDSEPPRFAATPAGSLLTGGAQSGVRDVTVKATDAGGGLWRAALQVDGREVLAAPFDGRQGQCALPFAQVRPCAAAGEATLRLDTASLPDGAHELSVVVSDVTGTNRAIHGPVAIRTANDPVTCAPGKPGAVLAGGLGKRGRARLVVPHGRAARLTGRFAGGAPGSVVVLERIARRRQAFAPQPARITPGAGGRIRVALPAGPSRDIRLGYRAAPGDATLHCTRAFRLRVRAKVRLLATPRTLQGARRTVRLFGRLPRRYLPAGGKVVQLEAFERGRWRTFKSVRTRKGGGFRTRYRFGAATTGTFPMRARAVREAEYPFEPATSKPVRVRVT